MRHELNEVKLSEMKLQNLRNLAVSMFLILIAGLACHSEEKASHAQPRGHGGGCQRCGIATMAATWQQLKGGKGEVCPTSRCCWTYCASCAHGQHSQLVPYLPTQLSFHQGLGHQAEHTWYSGHPHAPSTIVYMVFWATPTSRT